MTRSFLIARVLLGVASLGGAEPVPSAVEGSASSPYETLLEQLCTGHSASPQSGGVGVWEYGGMGVWEYGRDNTPTPPHSHTPTLTDHLTLLATGRSAEGRLIPLLRATRSPQTPEETVRILLLGNQHGDEPGPLETLLELWQRWARSGPDTLPDPHVTVLLIPLVNPDGKERGTRQSARGVDLNRDWRARTQPETQFVEQVFRQWRPHLVVDLHSFDPNDPGTSLYGSSHTVEILRQSEPERRVLQERTTAWQKQLVADLRAAGVEVRASYSTPERFPCSLAHRHFARDHGVVALLFESRHGEQHVFRCFLEALFNCPELGVGACRPGVGGKLGAGWLGVEPHNPLTPGLSNPITPEPRVPTSNLQSPISRIQLLHLFLGVYGGLLLVYVISRITGFRIQGTRFTGKLETASGILRLES